MPLSVSFDPPADANVGVTGDVGDIGPAKQRIREFFGRFALEGGVCIHRRILRHHQCGRVERDLKRRAGSVRLCVIDGHADRSHDRDGNDRHEWGDTTPWRVLHRQTG